MALAINHLASLGYLQYVITRADRSLRQFGRILQALQIGNTVFD